MNTALAIKEETLLPHFADNDENITAADAPAIIKENWLVVNRAIAVLKSLKGEERKAMEKRMNCSLQWLILAAKKEIEASAKYFKVQLEG